MKHTNVERKLDAYLQKGEQVRWYGETETFPLLGRDVRAKILAKWIGTVLVGGVTLFLYLRANEEPSVGFLGGVLAVAALLLVSPLAERYSVGHQRYWITDRRAILMTWDGTFCSMDLNAVDAYRVMKGGNGQDCLVLGSCLFEEAKKLLRWRACHPKLDSQSDGSGDAAQGLIFYCPGDVEGAVAQLGEKSFR